MTARWTIVFAAAALSACAATDVYDESGAGHVADASAILAGVDWTQAERARVVLSEFAFAPRNLVLHGGRPYRLRIENRGGVPHTFTAEDFFKAIAVERLESADGIVERPYLESVAVPPGGAKDLYFLPVEAGDYALECSLPLHAAFGMTGTVTVD